MGTLQAVQIHFKLTFVIFEMAVLAVVFNYFGEITVDGMFDYKLDKTLRAFGLHIYASTQVSKACVQYLLKLNC